MNIVGFIANVLYNEYCCKRELILVNIVAKCSHWLAMSFIIVDIVLSSLQASNSVSTVANGPL